MTASPDRPLLALLRSRATLVWALLVVATVAAWVAAHESTSDAVTIVVLAIGCVKGRFVGVDFMELRSAPVALNVAFQVWLLVLLVALSAFVIAA